MDSIIYGGVSDYSGYYVHMSLLYLFIAERGLGILGVGLVFLGLMA